VRATVTVSAGRNDLARRAAPNPDMSNALAEGISPHQGVCPEL